LTVANGTGPLGEALAGAGEELFGCGWETDSAAADVAATARLGPLRLRVWADDSTTAKSKKRTTKSVFVLVIE
jgi:hypothetical protein